MRTCHALRCHLPLQLAPRSFQVLQSPKLATCNIILTTCPLCKGVLCAPHLYQTVRHCNCNSANSCNCNHCHCMPLATAGAARASIDILLPLPCPCTSTVRTHPHGAPQLAITGIGSSPRRARVGIHPLPLPVRSRPSSVAIQLLVSPLQLTAVVKNATF